jgi:hypothetical protein
VGHKKRSCKLNAIEQSKNTRASQAKFLAKAGKTFASWCLGCLDARMNKVGIVTQSKRPPIWAWLAFAFVGLIVGAGSALAVSGGALSAGNIMVGRWSTDPSVGSQAANPWLRARIARVGLLALAKSETLYFDRRVDEDGNLLREACTYKLTGVPIAARWWSMTIYGDDQFLPRNIDSANSIDATRALPNASSAWTGTLSAQRPQTGGLWLSSKAGDTFSITLRLYNPSTIDPTALAGMDFPKIALISCGDTKPTEPR